MADKATICVYFFFDGQHDDRRFQTHNGLLRTLLSQVMDRYDGIPGPLMELYRLCDKGHIEPSNATLSNTLHALLLGFSHVYVIMDALDECGVHERPEPLSWLGQLINEISENLHLMVTSHPLLDIEGGLNALQAVGISVAVKAGNCDIKEYVQQKLQNDIKFKKRDAAIKELIQGVLLERAQGMYVTVTLCCP